MEKCCVPGCAGKQKLIKFPNPAKQPRNFKAWVSFIGVKASEYSYDYQKIYDVFKEKRICNIHFTPVELKAKNGCKIVMYTVPDKYGPEHWHSSDSKNSKKEIDAKNKVPKREHNLPRILRGKEKKHADEPIPTTTSPRIVRKRSIPSIPTLNKLPRVELERLSIQELESKLSDRTEVETKVPENNLSETSTPEKILPDTKSDRKSPEKNIPDTKSGGEKIRDTKRITQNFLSTTVSEKTLSDTQDESVFISDDEDVFANSDSDEDYEVEYLDSDIEQTDTEESPPAEIEYLDMDKLEFEDNQVSTNNTARGSKQGVPDANKPITPKKFEKKQKVVTNESSHGSKAVMESINTQTPWRYSGPEVATETNKKATLEATKVTNKEIEVTTGQTPIPNEIVYEDVGMVVEVATESQEVLAESPKKQPADKYKPILEVDSTSGTISIKLVNNEQETKESSSNFVLDDGPIKSASKQQQKTQEPSLYGDELSMVKQSSTADQNGSVIIKLVGNEPTITKSDKNHVSDDLPIPEVADIKTNRPPAQYHNRSLLLKQSTESSPKIHPIVMKPLKSDTIEDFVAKNKLKIIDSNTPLHKQLTASIKQLQKEHNVKLPIEITSPHLQKQLAATSSQNLTASDDITNVYVLENNNSTPTKNLEGSSLVNTLTVANGSLATPSQQKYIPALTERPFTFNKTNTPSATQRGLIKELKEARKIIKKLKTSQYSLKSKLKASKNILSNPTFSKICKRMPRIARIIVTTQLREGITKKQGRRFTDEEKLLARMLREQCPSTYRYMLRMGFILPDGKAQRVKSLDVESAINRNDAVSKLKAKVEKMTPEERLCTLLFDEKLINPENRTRQVVTSLGSQGEETEVTFDADHALIFMVKGIVKYHEEPVSYTFSFGPTPGNDLANQIKSVIVDLQTIGYTVLATICDHAENNRVAIETLTNESNGEIDIKSHNQVFKVNGEEIIALYDPSHLLKGIRNHLISKQLSFELNGQSKTAMWQHLEMVLSENPEYNGERLISKLTDSHVYPNKFGITKIKFAAQLFSQTVSTYMRYLADKEILPAECRDTADLLLFFDQLFDSLNSYEDNKHKKGKHLLLPVKLHSPHRRLWVEAIDVLRTMQFINNGNVVPVSDIDCWIWTLEGYRILVNKLFKEYKVQCVWMRYINQDALERLFRKDVNPTPKVKAKPKKEEPTYYRHEVVTQKVVKAITRMNREADDQK